MAETGRFPSIIRPGNFCFFGVWAPMVWIFCVAHESGVDYGGLMTTPILYAALSLLLVVVVLAYRHHPKGHDLIWLSVFLGITTPFATLLLCLPLPFSGAVAAGWGAVLGGIGVGWMYIRWAKFYSMIDIRDAIACMLVALIIGSVLKAVIDFLPQTASAVVIATLPPLSFIMSRIAIASPPKATHSEVAYTASTIPHLWKFVLGVIAFGFAIGVINGIDVGLSAPLTAPTDALLHGIETLIGVVAYLWVFLKEHEFGSIKVWRVILFFMATGLMIMPFLSGDARAVALALIGVAQTIIVILLWLSIADVSHHCDMHPYAIFGGGWLAYTGSLVLGYLFAFAISGLSTASDLADVLAYLIIIAFAFLLDAEPKGIRPLFADLGPQIPASTELDDMDRSCERIGREKGLTDREVEVMELLCRGRSKSYIAETLFISENTVRGHSKRIYTKLDVHDRQELIDLVSAGSAATPAAVTPRNDVASARTVGSHRTGRG